MSRILVVGSLNMDVVARAPRIPVAGETISGSGFFTAPGGKGANQAYAAAKLGGQVAMLGCVGEDAFGEQMRENLRASGCDVTGLRNVPGPSGAAVICVSDAGQNSIVVIAGANYRLSAADVEREAASFEGCSMLLLQLETPVESSAAAARIAKERGARVILDPAPAPAGPLPEELIRAADILTPNETEACILTGAAPAALRREEAEQVAGRLQQRGVPAVIVKLGEQGCLLAANGTYQLIPAPQVKAVDTTAAGDVFNGALAVALSEGATLPDACRFAVGAAALSVTRAGTQSSAPARAEADEFLRRLGQGAS